MKLFNPSSVLFICLVITLSNCKPEEPHVLKQALTFYASFDGNTNADFSLGDEKMYTANSVDEVNVAIAGMLNGDHQVLKDKGKYGDAFEFGDKSDTVVFYKAKDNIGYEQNNLSGTVSFWLSLDPAKDLKPGYTDPIQITDVTYNDGAIWVDFFKENPRDFRLGVFGDIESWIQDTLQTSSEVEFEKRLVPVKNPPFKSGKWTHIAITYSGLGTATNEATLYMDGKKIGSISGLTKSFTWDLDKANIYLGINFIGLMDDLAIFNKPFSEEEVMEIYQMKDGVKGIL